MSRSIVTSLTQLFQSLFEMYFILNFSWALIGLPNTTFYVCPSSHLTRLVKLLMGSRWLPILCSLYSMAKEKRGSITTLSVQQLYWNLELLILILVDHLLKTNH